MDIKQLKLAMVNAGMTQKDLAARIGVSEGTFIRKKQHDSFTLKEMQIIADSLA